MKDTKDMNNEINLILSNITRLDTRPVIATPIATSAHHATQDEVRGVCDYGTWVATHNLHEGVVFDAFHRATQEIE